MKKIILPTIAVSFIFSLIFLSYNSSYANSKVDHPVISEVQVIGSSANDEFVELYNPTEFDIDISGWKLRKISSSGTESPLVASLSGTIKSYGFFLIVHPDVSANYQYDNLYSSDSYAISNNNAVILEDNASMEIDKIGWGSVPTPGYETLAIIGPGSGESLERKASNTSTLASMTNEESFKGNSYDSNNNYNDFILRNIPEPQNSSSPIEEPEKEVSPTETSSEEPTATPTEIPTQTPYPTFTPTPTEEPTITPVNTPTPTFEPTQTPIPTESLPTEEPTTTPTEIPEITATPTPIASTAKYEFPFIGLTCGYTSRVVRFGFIIFRVPIFSCTKF